MKKEKVILGITAFNHDSSACLIYRGKLVAFCEEERFNKMKHTGEFPVKSIDFCIKKAGLLIDDITDIAFYFYPAKCIVSYLRNNNPILYILNPSLLKRKRFYYEMIWLLNFVNKIQSIKRLVRNDRIKITYVDHHISHVWYGYFASNFENCTVISNDSVGETISSLAVRFSRKNNKILAENVFSQNDPHSLGYLYGAITEFLGFKRGSEEGKVMALAALGTHRYLDYFNDAITYLPGGEFRINNKLIYPRSFQPKTQRVSDKFISRFGSYRKPEENLTQHHYDIAYALQRVTELILKHQISVIHNGNIVLTGGVAQNSLVNGKLNNIFVDKNIFIPPIPNDAGCSIGAAIFLYHKYYQHLPEFSETAFLGPEFDKDEITDILKSNKINYRQIKDPALFVASELLNDRIVAVFRGKMECGPRALGHRSILCNPLNPKMKDFLNLKVKSREFFQPYGGIILDKDVKEVFDYRNKNVSGPYMSFVYPVKKEWVKKIPSLVHFDNTSRTQIINKGRDVFLENIIENFCKRSGISIIINTSLNLKGQPIAMSPQDALNVFYNSAIDYILFNDSILVSKNE